MQHNNHGTMQSATVPLHSSRYKLVIVAPASEHGVNTGSFPFDRVFLIANAAEYEGSQLSDCSDPPTELSILHQCHLVERAERQ